MDAPPGYNPNVSVFQGGDSVQIAPMQGGAISIADILSATQASKAAAPVTEIPDVPATELENVPLASQPGIAAAATIGAFGAALQPGATAASTAQAGVLAAIRANKMQKQKPILESVNLSNQDNKILITARPGDEQQGASNAGILAYDDAIKAGQSEPEAAEAKIKAAVDFIKTYRKTHPYTDNSISMDTTQSEALSIINTTDPKEKDVGQKAYDTSYALSIQRGKSDKDAIDIATIAKVNAIKHYRKYPKRIKVEKMMSAEEATKLLNTTDSVERELGELASRKAIEDAKKRRIPQSRWTEIGVIAAAERIQLQRGDKRVLETIKKRPALISSVSGAIKEIAELPLYIEYSQITKALTGPYLEMYESRVANVMVGNTFEANMKASIRNYQIKQTEKWAKASSTATLPQTKAKTSFSPGEIITSFSRLTHVLPIITEDIIVLPPMNGNVNTFMKALKTLDEMGVITPDLIIKKNTVVVCTGPFYQAKADVEQISKNNVLLSIVLDIIEKSPGQWFTLAEHTSEEYLVGSTFVGRGPNELLINMIEPSYVVYPYRRKGLEGIIISSSKGVSLPADASKKVSLRDIYTNKSFGKPILQAYKPDLKVEGAPGFFTVVGALEPMTVPTERVGSCGLANYSLPEAIPTLHPSKKIRLSTNVKGDGIILAFRLQVKGHYEPLCATEVVEKDNSKKFVGSPEAHINPTEVQTAYFEVAGKMLQIRKTNKADKVYENWRRGIYSEPEAELLNILNLSPAIMDDIFPMTFNENGEPISVPWKDWVANFLSTVTIKDKSLTTHRETMIVRNFLERVRAYFISIGLKEDLEESDSENTALQHGLLEPDGVDDLDKEDLRDIKREWGKLDVYEDKANSEWICSIVLVNKNTYKQLYKTVGVPTEQYNRNTAKSALDAKVSTLKGKYPDWIFIY